MLKSISLVLALLVSASAAAIAQEKRSTPPSKAELRARPSPDLFGVPRERIAGRASREMFRQGARIVSKSESHQPE